MLCSNYWYLSWYWPIIVDIHWIYMGILKNQQQQNSLKNIKNTIIFISYRQQHTKNNKKRIKRIKKEKKRNENHKWNTKIETSSKISATLCGRDLLSSCNLQNFSLAQPSQGGCNSLHIQKMAFRKLSSYLRCVIYNL